MAKAAKIARKHARRISPLQGKKSRGAVRSQAEQNNRAAAQEHLTRAFVTFTQAASSLEKSYTQLQAEVARLHQELQNANSELEQSLQENARVRAYLSRVLESLPCGVLVLSADGQTQIINPEARRLLQVEADENFGPGKHIPESLEKLIGDLPVEQMVAEMERPMPGNANECLGI